MTDIMISELNLIKKVYDKTGSVEVAVQSVVELFDRIGKARYDVANCVFDYKEIFQIEFFKLQYKNYFKELEEKYKKEENPEGLLKVAAMVFFALLSKNKEISKTIVNLAKEQTSEEYFKKLENAMFKEQKELMKSMLEPVEYMTREESFTTLRSFYQNEYKSMVYETELLNLYEELVKENEVV